jgi:hypothetical protein
MNNNVFDKNMSKYIDNIRKNNILTPQLHKLLQEKLSVDDYYFFIKLTKKMTSDELKDMFNRIIISKCVQINIDGIKNLLF